MPIYCKEFLAIYHASNRVTSCGKQRDRHLYYQITDNRFFQTKATPSALWNACDYVIQFKYRIILVTGSQKTAAEFLSRLEMTPKEKVHMKLRDDILTSPIEVNLQSTDVADEEQPFFLPDEEEEMEQEVFANNVQMTIKRKN